MIKIAFIDLNDSIKVGEFGSNIYLASYLLEKFKNSNYEIYIDLFASLEEYTRSKKVYDFLCFSVNGYNLQKILKNEKLIDFFKKIASIKIIGGPGPTIIPFEAIKIADIVVIGEGEETLYELIKEYSENYDSYVSNKELYLKSLKKRKTYNIVFKLYDSIFTTERKFSSQMDFVSINFDLINNIENYISNWPYLDYLDYSVRGISIITSRSCLFNCYFCQPTLREIFGNKVKFMNVDLIVNQLIQANKKYNINAFMIHDDTFTMNKEHVESFCNQLIYLKKEGIYFKWICNSRADTLNESLIKLMKEAGCIEIRLGIETWNEKLRNEYLGKRINDEKINNAISLIKKYKINAMAFFMLGLEGQNIKDIIREIFVSANSDLDLVSYSIFTPLPGTYLGKRYGVKTFESYYFSNKNNPSEINKVILELFRIFGILLFYFHPKRLKRTINSIFKKNIRYKLKRLFSL